MDHRGRVVGRDRRGRPAGCRPSAAAARSRRRWRTAASPCRAARAGCRRRSGRWSARRRRRTRTPGHRGQAGPPRQPASRQAADHEQAEQHEPQVEPGHPADLADPAHRVDHDRAAELHRRHRGAATAAAASAAISSDAGATSARPIRVTAGPRSGRRSHAARSGWFGAAADRSPARVGTSPTIAGHDSRAAPRPRRPSSQSVLSRHRGCSSYGQKSPVTPSERRRRATPAGQGRSGPAGRIR